MLSVSMPDMRSPLKRKPSSPLPNLQEQGLSQSQTQTQTQSQAQTRTQPQSDLNAGKAFTPAPAIISVELKTRGASNEYLKDRHQ